MSAFLLLLVIAAGCEEGNDNWKIITTVPEGVYVTGDATIYSAAATASSLTSAPLDNAPEGTIVNGIYTWLKSSGSFTIMKVDAEGAQVNYGKGEVVATTPFETVKLVANATAFSVAKDGLYYIAYNAADNQVTVIPAEFGIIGDATPGLWDKETVMEASYNSDLAVVEMTLKDVSLDKKQIKFRYANMWGVKLPYAGSEVTLHSNMGNVSDPKTILPLSDAFSECKGGGENFSLGTKGTYDVVLKVDLRSKTFSAKAICTGEDTSTAELPAKMFVVGSPAEWNWNWANAAELTPVNSHDGMFWGIYYFEAGSLIKFNNEMAWNGNEFGAMNEEPNGYGEIATGGSNLKIATAGYYQVVVTCSLSSDKKSVIKKITLAEPAIYLVGVTSNGGWGNIQGDNNKFLIPTNPTDDFVSPAFIANTDANNGVRMCIKITGVDWWQAEFNVYDGKIAYRGVGGDQALVSGTVGQKVYLNFKTGAGSIK